MMSNTFHFIQNNMSDRLVIHNVNLHTVVFIQTVTSTRKWRRTTFLHWEVITPFMSREQPAGQGHERDTLEEQQRFLPSGDPALAHMWGLKGVPGGVQGQWGQGSCPHNEVWQVLGALCNLHWQWTNQSQKTEHLLKLKYKNSSFRNIIVFISVYSLHNHMIDNFYTSKSHPWLTLLLLKARFSIFSIHFLKVCTKPSSYEINHNTTNFD